jgi:hypothetical protein
MRNIPEDAIGISIMDFGRFLKPFMEIFKQAYAGMALNKSAEAEPGKDQENKPFETFLKNLRFDRLPSFDYMAPFLGIAVGYSQFKGGDIVSRTIIEYGPKNLPNKP